MTEHELTEQERQIVEAYRQLVRAKEGPELWILGRAAHEKVRDAALEDAVRAVERFWRARLEVAAAASGSQFSKGMWEGERIACEQLVEAIRALKD